MSGKAVSRLARKLDIVSLVFIAIGVALFAIAFLGMAELRDQQETAFVPGTMEAYAAMNRYFRLQKLSYMGIGFAVLGIGVALSAAWHSRKFGKASADPSLRSG